MKKPSYQDAEKCIEIRKRSKQVKSVTDEEHLFSRNIFEKFEDWYSASEARIFNETVPFGSQVRIKDELYGTD